MDKQKYVVYVKGSPLFERGMFHIYLKEKGIKPSMRFVFKMNEEDFRGFISDKNLDDVEIFEPIDMDKTPIYLMNRRAKLIMNSEKMFTSLSEVHKFLSDSFSDIKSKPFYKRITQIINNVNKVECNE